MKFRDWEKKSDEVLSEAMGFVQKLDYQKKGKGKDTKMSKSVDTPKDINKAVQMLVKGVQAKINADFKKSYPNLKPTILKIEKGKRYIKIVAITDGGKGQKSVHTFVDTKEGNTFGDILKPASWRAPAKHARGNVFDGSWGVNAVGVYGPAYLR
jgi:hypothetical protein